MTGELRSLLNTKCSLVVQCIDAFTGGPPAVGGVEVGLRESSQKPIRKPGGLYVFTDIRQNEVALSTTSYAYINQSLTVKLDELNPLQPIVLLTLMPAAVYPFRSHVTRIWGQVAGGEQETIITAYPYGEETAIARIGQDTVAAGEHEFQIGQLKGALTRGDYLWLQSKRQSSGELIRIEHREKERRIGLGAPLQQAFQRGDQLFPAIHTQTYRDGEFLLPIRSDAAESYAMRMVFAQGQKRAVRELTIQAGSVNRMTPVMPEEFH